MSYFLTIEDIENICYEYAKAHLKHDEPIPSFNSRYPDKLETALFPPQKTFGNKLMYPTLEEQASVLFYSLNKLHPFENGNKRIASVSLFSFLLLNEKWLKVDWKELYDVAMIVAKSDPENREGIIKLLIDFIKNNIKDFKITSDIADNKQ